MKKKLIIATIALMAMFMIVYANDFVPQGNIDMKGVYGVRNLTNITLKPNCSDGEVLKFTDGVAVCGNSTGGGSAAGWSENSTDVFVYNNTANVRVGIGTSSPSAGLQINTSNPTLRTNGSVFIDGGLTLGTTPATVGIIRLPNGQLIGWRNSDNTGNETLGLVGNSLVFSGTSGGYLQAPYVKATSYVAAKRIETEDGDALGLGNNNVQVVFIGSGTGLTFGTDNTYDIGASGATRPRTGYFGTSVVTPTIDSPTAELATPAADLVLDNNFGIRIKDTGGTARLTFSINPSDESEIYANAGGDGGDLKFNTRSGGVESWRITPNAHFLAANDNSFDIGASGATRPRTVHVGSSVIVGSANNVTNISLSVNGTLFVNNSMSNVGIGTQSPGQKLTVVGSANFTSLVIYTNWTATSGNGSRFCAYVNDTGLISTLSGVC